MAGIKWVSLFLLAYSTYFNRVGMVLLGPLAGTEILLGFTGFFSEFRYVLFVLGASYLAVRQHLSLKSWAVLSLLFCLTLFLATFWTTVKKEFRGYVSGGTGAQVVMNSLEDRVGYLFDQASQLQTEDMESGFYQLMERVSYIDILASTLDNVPANVPHQEGHQLSSALLHIILPRVLFPEKGVLDDTETTYKYTNLPIAMENVQNTSISIGYLGELYVDFGWVGAGIAAFLLGSSYGFFYRRLRDFRKLPKAVNLGLCMAAAIPLGTFEIALVKLIGASVMTFLTLFILQRLLIPRVVAAWQVRRPDLSRPAGSSILR
jgi:hypothetical protein